MLVGAQLVLLGIWIMIKSLGYSLWTFALIANYIYLLVMAWKGMQM